MLTVDINDTLITFTTQDQDLQQKLSSWFSSELTVDGDEFYFVDDSIGLKCEFGISPVEALLHFIDTFMLSNAGLSFTINYHG